MTYKDFLTTPEGRKVSRQLVTNLIEQQIGQEHGVSSMCLGIQVKLMFRSIRSARLYSGSVELSVNLGMLLFTRSAASSMRRVELISQAEENLRRAEYSRDPSERAECLAESFRLFSKAAKDITPSKVAPIAKRYHDIGFTRGKLFPPERAKLTI
jgi:nuclear pore complex protein Nup155